MPKEEKDSSWYAYVCEHQASNAPCQVCWPSLWSFPSDYNDLKKAEPIAGAVKDNWQEEVVTDVTSGLTDNLKLEG